MALPTHKTKIVCTIGPASKSLAVMKQMIESGMNVARMNFSHGDFAAHKKVIENLRAASAFLGRRIAIMADLSGPKMWIGMIDTEPIDLRLGDPFTLTTDDILIGSFLSMKRTIRKTGGVLPDNGCRLKVSRQTLLF